MTKISIDMIEAIKVMFLKPIFEDDFPEKGMTAWLTDVEWDDNADCYKLFFDFTDFEAINLKYFKELYYSNIHTTQLPKKSKYTAIEAGYYTPKYSVFFSTSDERRNDRLFAEEITKYLKVLD